jgi:hypothetical protein
VIGAVLTIVFVGLLIVAGGLRATRAVGRTQRALAEAMLGEAIPAPDPFSPPPGFFPWLRAALLDTTAWRGVLYLIAKVPLGLFGAWFALSIWLNAITSVFSALDRTWGLSRRRVGDPRNSARWRRQRTGAGGLP